MNLLSLVIKSKTNMKIHGWGCYPKINAEILYPESLSDCQKNIKNNLLIARGNGRSYGDSANANIILSTNFLKKIINFDKKNGLLTVETGITINEILNLIVPNGWFLPVTPGTSYATIGGIIASDAHGKNHSNRGTISEYVNSISLILGTGDIVTISKSELPELFQATCGGMGLTGMIVSATIKLIPIASTLIDNVTIKANSLEEILKTFEENTNCEYSLAWVDSFAAKKNIGRGLVFLGNHNKENLLQYKFSDPINIPSAIPKFFLNNFGIKFFNAIYFNIKKDKKNKTNIPDFFYTLDKLKNWNKFYGKNGFIQYQFVIPKLNGCTNLKKILTQINNSGTNSFLSVLKKFGKKNDNLLSFPIEGYSFALDFKLSTNAINLLRNLDNTIIDMGGKIYLAKDALMSEEIFKKIYPSWENFESIRLKYGAIGKFSSKQSLRLGLL